MREPRPDDPPAVTTALERLRSVARLPIPVRYRAEYRELSIPYGDAVDVVRPGDLVVYAASSWVSHEVELVRFIDRGHYKRAMVRHLASGSEWNVDPDQIFAFAADQAQVARQPAAINTIHVRRIDRIVQRAEFLGEFDSFQAMYPALTGAQAQLASQALKMLYVAMLDEDQIVCADCWETPYLATYRNTNGAELYPGWEADGVRPIPKPEVP
jgi:hypothetical protein